MSPTSDLRILARIKRVSAGVVNGWVTYREVIRNTVRVRPKYRERSGDDCMVRVRPPEVSSFSPLFSPRLSPCSGLWGSDRLSRLFMAEREHCVSLLDSLSRPPCSWPHLVWRLGSWVSYWFTVDTSEHLARHFHCFFSFRRRQDAFRFCLAGAVSLLCSASIPVLLADLCRSFERSRFGVWHGGQAFLCTGSMAAVPSLCLMGVGVAYLTGFGGASRLMVSIRNSPLLVVSFFMDRYGYKYGGVNLEPATSEMTRKVSASEAIRRISSSSYSCRWQRTVTSKTG
ncbi:BnaCnng74440D [Brassica napus]|uniref:Uncharacterized protein n=3 Tax=Brassica TaxID=3705 RepID=A0A0D3DC24_BRAOL|nr:unnamed protein product [Brassica napus]CDY71781.1 BnaCnng74440D [Brassica napus]VDD38697.1 unnamed protein product [Brassica oleracea]